MFLAIEITSGHITSGHITSGHMVSAVLGGWTCGACGTACDRSGKPRG